MAAERISEVQLRQVLLVQAIETSQSSSFTPEQQLGAAVAALSARSDSELLAQRAACLSRDLPEGLRPWLSSGGIPRVLAPGVFVLCLLLGLSANYLGGDQQFHVVYNPVSLLLIWNLLAYIALLWAGARSAHAPAIAVAVVPESDPRTPGENPARAASTAVRPPWWLRRLLPKLWPRYLAWRHGLEQSRQQARQWQQVGVSFINLYLVAAGPLLRTQLRLLLHLAALALSIGAVAGLYLHGLFAEYFAVWRSTFVAEPATIAVLLNLLLAPAALLLDGSLIQLDAVRDLLGPGGAPASAWLHKLALMSAMLVLVPRGLLVLHLHRARARQAGDLKLDLSQAYFRQVLEHTRLRHIDRIRDGLATEIRQQIAELAEQLADYVETGLFDLRIDPQLREFRQHGGRVDQLEAAIRDQTLAFEPALQEAINQQQREFTLQVQARLQAVIGREWAIARSPDLVAQTSGSTRRFGAAMGEAVAGDVTGAIGVVVTTAVSAAVGSISGGIGKGIGIAILSHLLGASGPVGLLLGALLGLAGGGALYVLGKDRLKGKVKTWRIPAAVARMALRDVKLAQARASIGEAVRAQIAAELEPMVETIISTLLQGLPRDADKPA